MRNLLLAALGVVVLTSSWVDAQTPNIDHRPVGCAVAERFPRLEARFAPGDAVAKARVLFRPENVQVWYAVAMKPEGPAFSGVLPKPKKSLKAFRYYIEVTDKTLGTNRTAEYTTNVVAGPGACQQKIMASALGSASVLLEVPAGAAALPAGFASTGVVTAGSGSAVAAAGSSAGGGGGLSTGAVVGIVGGVGAAAAGVAVAAAKGGEGSPTTYSGPLNGQLTLTETVTSTAPGGGTTTTSCSWVRALSGTIRITLEQSNGTATGQAQTSVIETETGRTGSGCSGPGPGGGNLTNSFMCAVTGTPGNLACLEQRSGTFQGLTNTHTFGFSGALSGGVISGMVTYGTTGQGSFDGGTTNRSGTTTHSGSTTFPVTLR